MGVCSWGPNSYIIHCGGLTKKVSRSFLDSGSKSSPLFLTEGAASVILEGGKAGRNAWASGGEHTSLWKEGHALDQSLANLEEVGGPCVPPTVLPSAA